MVQRFKSSHNLPKSIDKLFSYLGSITKEPFTVEFDKFKKKYIPPKKVIISDNLFRQYNCLNENCSRCCWKIRDWNIFTSNQFDELKSKYLEGSRTLIPKIININNNNITFYVENNTKKVCPHLDRKNNLCKIHILNPIHCALPLIKFKNIKGRTHITREYFKRNWLMGCPAKFKKMDENGYKTTIFMLNRVKQMAEELNINTYIDKIIDEVKEKWRKRKTYGKQTNLFTCGNAINRTI